MPVFDAFKALDGAAYPVVAALPPRETVPAPESNGAGALPDSFIEVGPISLVLNGVSPLLPGTTVRAPGFSGPGATGAALYGALETGSRHGRRNQPCF